MTEPRPPARPPTAEESETAVRQLSRHFAAGRIELDDLERRMELVVRARSLEDLRVALDGLGTPARAPVAGEPGRAPAVAPPGPIARTVAVMSLTQRRGPWTPAPVHRVIAVMGAARLDLREAVLPEGGVAIRVAAVMGGLTVIVPPDVDLEVDGWAFMGAVAPPRAAPAGARGRVRIYARAVMGGVAVRVRERRGADPDAARDDDEADEPPERRRRRGRAR